MAIGWGFWRSARWAACWSRRCRDDVVVVVAGMGNGAATAVSWPLLTALIPPERRASLLGLKAAAESVAIPLSVLVASEVFLPRFGYRGIFAMLAMNIVLALVLLLRFVHVPRPPSPSSGCPRLIAEHVRILVCTRRGGETVDAADFKIRGPKRA